MTTSFWLPSATFCLRLSFHLHHASASVRVSTPAVLLVFCSFSIRLSGLHSRLQEELTANKQRPALSPPLADRKQSSGAEQWGCCRTFSARSLRNAYSQHPSREDGCKVCINQNNGRSIDQRMWGSSGSFTESVCVCVCVNLNHWVVSPIMLWVKHKTHPN